MASGFRLQASASNFVKVIGNIEQPNSVTVTVGLPKMRLRLAPTLWRKPEAGSPISSMAEVTDSGK